MSTPEAPTGSVTLPLPSPDATAALAMRLAPTLGPGDTLLLEGPIGAGKSHFCRALISARLAAEGRQEEIPSPSFTLVQTYDLAGCDVWHVDLFRLSGPEQAVELGLDEAFSEAIVLVEWPDRLGALAPAGALRLRIEPDGGEDARTATICATSPRWAGLLAALGTKGAAQ